MTNEPVSAVSAVTTGRGARVKDAPADAASLPLADARRANGSLADYFALTKPRLNFLVVATSAAGYYLGGPAHPDAGGDGAGGRRARRSSPAAPRC